MRQMQNTETNKGFKAIAGYFNTFILNIKLDRHLK